MRARHAWFASVCLLTACAHSPGGGDPDGAGDDDGPPGDGPPGDGPPGDGPIDAPTDAPIDAAPVAMTWRDDSAVDFTAATLLDQAAVEAYGAVSPAAYYTGGLLWRAANADTFDSGPNATWAVVSGFPSTGKVAITRSTSLAFFADTPPSVGLTDPDTFSMWFEGEVFLDAGAYTFEMLVDDHGFLELAPSPTAAFQRVVSCDWPSASTGTFNAATAGWFPIRFAASEGGGEALIRLHVMGPGIAALQPIPRHRLRARTSGVVGMFQSGFDDGHLLGDVEHTVDQVTPANTNWNTGNPGDLGMTDSDDWSVRWTGQFRVDVGGSYAFRLVTDDGQRLWVDGQRLLDTWDDQTHDATTAPVALAPGWHDLVVDQTERGGGAIAVLSVASGPDLVGQTLPLDRLRPVEGRAERHETGVDRTDRTIADLGSAQSAVTVTAPAGATVTGVDVSYSFDHSFWGDLEITLVAPSGASAVVRPRSGGSMGGPETQRVYTSALNGGPAAGTWVLRASDLASQDSGTLLDFQVTPHFTGGEPPIAPAAAYESAVRDLGAGIAAITRVSWVERLPAGADIAVRMRTCEAAASCAAEPWSAPITDPAGGAPAVTPRRFAQYRIELSSDGDRSPALDEITVDYAVTP